MADQTEADGRAVLSLFTPPAGHEFVGGFVATHDLNQAHLASLVAPILQSVTATDPRRRVLETRRHRPGQQLVVLAAADRITYGGGVIPWLKVIPVYGRRLHAKFGVLQFKPEEGAILTRAFVTSANMTSGGLISNHEFLLCDEYKLRAKQHLAFDLIRAVGTLRPELPLSDREMVHSAIDVLRQNLGRNWRKTGTVSHSLDRQRDITATWAKKVLGTSPNVAQVTVVSPGFAARTDEVSSPGLDRVVTRADAVRLITNVDSEGHPICSTAALGRLRSSELSIETPGVSEDPRERGRSLHAKLLAASTTGKWHHVLIGSANFTTRGLSGQNRELVVLCRLRDSSLQDVLSGIAPVRTLEEPVDRADAEFNDEVERPVESVAARFVIDSSAHASQLRWNGTLHLDVEGAPPTRIAYGETVLIAADSQPLVLNSSDTKLLVTYPRRDLQIVPIEVEPPEGQDEQFWAGIGSGEELEDDPFLRMLLKDLRLSASSGTEPTGNSPARNLDDRFQIPLRQRLVVVVRNRHRIDEQVPPTMLKAAVERYLEEDGPEAIKIGLAAVLPSEFAADRSLVGTFAQALSAFPQETPT